MKEALTNLIIAEINDFNEADLIELNNLYCDSINAQEGIIYSNDEDFFEMINFTGLQVAQAVFYGDYNYSHNLVSFDGYGNFKSYQYFSVESLVELPKVMGEYILDNFYVFDHLFTSQINELINE
jgi:hypothetical protein